MQRSSHTRAESRACGLMMAQSESTRGRKTGLAVRARAWEACPDRRGLGPHCPEDLLRRQARLPERASSCAPSRVPHREDPPPASDSTTLILYTSESVTADEVSFHWQKPMWSNPVPASLALSSPLCSHFDPAELRAVKLHSTGLNRNRRARMRHPHPSPQGQSRTNFSPPARPARHARAPRPPRRRC